MKTTNDKNAKYLLKCKGTLRMVLTIAVIVISTTFSKPTVSSPRTYLLAKMPDDGKGNLIYVYYNVPVYIYINITV